jgi:hypothetical protein
VLVTRFAARHAVAVSAAVDSPLHVAFHLAPRRLTGLMLGAPEVANLMAASEIVL